MSKILGFSERLEKDLSDDVFQSIIIFGRGHNLPFSALDRGLYINYNPWYWADKFFHLP